MVSYSVIRGFGSGKSSLPSVDSWGQNFFVERAPSSILEE